MFNHPGTNIAYKSNLSIEQLIFEICRGVWPEALTIDSKKEKLFFAKDIFNQTCNKDISAIDQVKRSPSYTKSMMKSLARNICTLAAKDNIFNDANANCGISESTFKEYYDALERLYIIKDIDAWCPAIRSKTTIRSNKKI